ncbi:MAG: VWA domain-containing protein [Oscillospiraceae bacterium]|nr:VWA domain-containing protein [Oscillospiraceae bacterium]
MKHSIQPFFALLLALCLILSLAGCAAAEKAEAGVDALGEAAIRSDIEAPAEEGGKDIAAGESKTELFYADKSAMEGVGLSGELNEAAPVYDREASLAEPMAPDDAGGPDDNILPGDAPDDLPSSAEPLKLTAAEWKDNDNWPFFTNLVNTAAISFPSFGLDPRHRLEVRVQGEDGTPRANETVSLTDAEGSALWQARTDKNGTAYLFWTEEQSPARVVCGTAEAPVQLPEADGDAQGNSQLRPVEAVTLNVGTEAQTPSGMQIMFIVDTTGSMSDEIAYLQKDFSAIAGRVGSEGMTWSANFYRDEGDEYVTRTNGFCSDVSEIQAKLNAEYADGGGDIPEAVAEILTECLAGQSEWDENAVKLAFLIFDAPPHDGKEAALQAAVHAAAEKGIRLIPVVASNAERETELFGRALAILTGGTYVFLTDDSGIGNSHLEPIVGNYEVELLQDLIVRIIDENRP